MEQRLPPEDSNKTLHTNALQTVDFELIETTNDKHNANLKPVKT